LERFDRLLPSDGGAWATPGSEGRLQWLRLELLQLKTCVTRNDGREVTVRQQQVVRNMVDTVLDWLDFEAVTATDIVRLRVGAAQDWLLEEAGSMGQDNANSGCHRKLG
jgi:hypothetical protein